MAATIDLFEWRSLTSAISKIQPASSFVLDTIFKSQENHMADKIDIEIATGKNKLARFVNKGERPHLVGKGDYQVQTVSLPRIFESKIFTADELASFKTTGNVYAGSAADIAQQSERYKAMELLTLKDRITRRMEMMACSILTTGALTVTQSNVELSYDFNYGDGVSKVTLTGADKWDAATPKITAQIQKRKREMLKNCGATPTLAILGTDAAAKFIEEAGVMKSLDNLNYKVGTLDLTGTPAKGADYLGKWLGIDWYVYGGSYVDDNGAEQELYGTKLCTLIAPDNSFRLHWGPIYRLENGETLTIRNNIYVAPVTDIYKQSLEWSIEAKPLPAVHNPDRVMAITTY